ncbi:MAG TPA: HDIG domain-containing protein [Thermoanaerobaculia bacterium]|jgi:putative nucleotidyltransferase with HDIG domain|nr:HDIG domain-containing protein [Thermoanaerobaculia bacterium]
MTMDRQAAWELMTANVQAQGLRRHMLAVEAAVRWYAAKLGADPDVWGLAGLLHDWDWEIHPTLDQHPAAGLPILRERGADDAVVQAIAAHNTEGTGVERQEPLDFALLACDEVTGLIIAAALVRPSKDVREVEVKSIKKRWKERAFAAGVDREHVEAVTADFSRACFDGKLELWAHVGNVLEAMQGAAADLDLDGRLVGNG